MKINRALEESDGSSARQKRAMSVKQVRSFAPSFSRPSVRLCRSIFEQAALSAPKNSEETPVLALDRSSGIHFGFQHLDSTHTITYLLECRASGKCGVDFWYRTEASLFP